MFCGHTRKGRLKNGKTLVFRRPCCRLPEALAEKHIRRRHLIRREQAQGVLQHLLQALRIAGQRAQAERAVCRFAHAPQKAVVGRIDFGQRMIQPIASRAVFSGRAARAHIEKIELMGVAFHLADHIQRMAFGLPLNGIA